MSVVRYKFRCNILISGKIIKEMSGSVASGTTYIWIYVYEYRQPWEPPSLSYTMVTGLFPRVSRPRCGVDHPPPSSIEVKGRVELNAYSSPVPS